MKNKALTIIGIVALILVLGGLVLCGVGGFCYYRYTGRYATTEKAGEEFGRTTDQQGCVDEGLRQTRNAPHETFAERYETLFIDAATVGCLRTAKSTANFCEDVPRPRDSQRDLAWKELQCAKAGLVGRPPCNKVFDRVITECGKIKQKTVYYPN